MSQIAVSVVIVSRGRPAALCRCLAGLEQLYYQTYEVIVVADLDGCSAVQDMGLDAAIKLIPFEEANISSARNAGIAQAAGEVVAFIDDDAVAEPTWLDYLIPPFQDAQIDAAGGFVLGRNGISFQSRANWVDSNGDETAIEIGSAPVVLQGSPGRAVKAEGTNCAFRRETLAELGGFDPVFRFYLDETDVAMRLAGAKRYTAIVPNAQVHHGFLSSAYRTAQRVPKSLHEIGASKVAFLRKHATFSNASLDPFRREQKSRLLRHMVAGTCEPRDVARLLGTLEDGFVDGKNRVLDHAQDSAKNNPEAPTPFLPFKARTAFRGHTFMTARWMRPHLRTKTVKQTRAGHRITLFCFSPTALYHRVSFENGVWIHRGGIFGRSVRSQPLLQVVGFLARVAAEKQRVAELRALKGTKHDKSVA